MTSADPGGSGARHDSPHDALFKAVFGEPANAAAEVERILPRALAEAIDPGTFALEPGSVVDPELRARHTDLLFRATLRGAEAFVYVLLEHQSTPDPLMPFRLLVYMVRIWERWLAGNPRARRLPAIVPVVVHQGPDPWRGARALEDLYDLPRAVRVASEAFLPRFAFLLDDLGAEPVEAIAARPLPSHALVALTLLRAARDSGLDLDAVVRSLLDSLAAILAEPRGGERFEQLMCYVLKVSDLPPGALAATVRGLGPRAEDTVMTTAEKLHQQGLREGLDRGTREGLERGTREGLERARAGLERALVVLLERRFGSLPPAFLARLRAADVDALLRATERVLTVATLEDVLDT